MVMELHNSISIWLEGVREGDAFAAQQIWNRYFEQLVRLARKRLPVSVKRAGDEEDVALSAFQSFFSGAAGGRFPQLDDRDDLWKVLVAITERKAWRHTRHERRQKRGGGFVLGEGCVPQGGDGPVPFRLDEQPAPEPTPELAAQMAEELDHLLALLDNATLRRVAVCKMQGYTVEEIGLMLGVSTRSVKRKLALIREVWTLDVADG
jgi:DNA-directed RNA polymerase specialized sigma24 family protein